MFFKWATVFSVRPCGNELGRRGMRRIPAASEFHVPVVEPVTEFVCLYRVFIFVFSFFFGPSFVPFRLPAEFRPEIRAIQSSFKN